MCLICVRWFCVCTWALDQEAIIKHVVVVLGFFILLVCSFGVPVIFVLAYCLVIVCLVVSNSEVIVRKDHLSNDLLYVKCNMKPYLIHTKFICLNSTGCHGSQTTLHNSQCTILTHAQQQSYSVQCLNSQNGGFSIRLLTTAGCC